MGLAELIYWIKKISKAVTGVFAGVVPGEGCEIVNGELNVTVPEFTDEISFKDGVQNSINKLIESTADVILTGTNAGDLQTAINNLTEGQILEIQTSTAYSQITIPTNKAFSIKVATGYYPSISGNNAITLTNGVRDVIISGLNLFGNGTSDANGKGSCICLAHQAKVENVIFHNLNFGSVSNGSAVMLSYHQSIGGDLYYTPPALNEFSDKIAFVECNFNKAGKDKTEGANLACRGVNNLYVYKCNVDAGNLTRGIQAQDCINISIKNNKVINCNDGNGGEAIKIDRIGSPVSYYQTGHIIGNMVDVALEGIDVDDFCKVTVLNNEVRNCVQSGIILDNDSIGLICGNTVYLCGSGIKVESGSLVEMHTNNSFSNTTNYDILNGYSLPTDNDQSSDNFNSKTYFSKNIMFTPDGGLAVKVTAGENLTRGEVIYTPVTPDGATGKVYKNPIDSQAPSGVVYQTALANADVWIVTNGIAYVLPDSAVTAARGNIIYSSVTTAGRVAQAATIPAATTHDRECGHYLDDGSGNGIAARAFLHFR